jgi:hypothetical protein
MGAGCLHLSNAAPEWQAGSVRGESRDPVAACPLKGLVRSVVFIKHRAQAFAKDQELQQSLLQGENKI